MTLDEKINFLKAEKLVLQHALQDRIDRRKFSDINFLEGRIHQLDADIKKLES